MSDYRLGDIVDVTIRGARVQDYDVSGDGPDRLMVTYGQPASMTTLFVNGVTVERVAPAEWPPQPGDVWRDPHGYAWFAFSYCPDPDHTDAWAVEAAKSTDFTVVALQPQHGGPYGVAADFPDKVLRDAGPLTLAYRPERTEDGAA
jgi:hypothetical protein